MENPLLGQDVRRAERSETPGRQDRAPFHVVVKQEMQILPAPAHSSHVCILSLSILQHLPCHNPTPLSCCGLSLDPPFSPCRAATNV